MITVTHDEIDAGALIRAAQRPEMGALVTFVGTVRDDDRLEAMELEAYEEAAYQELAAIRDEALERYAIDSVDIVHRVGRLQVGDTIVVIVIGAGHRKEAFPACEFVIDRLKQTVPIWKKEYRPGGEEWVAGESRGKRAH